MLKKGFCELHYFLGLMGFFTGRLAFFKGKCRFNNLSCVTGMNL